MGIQSFGRDTFAGKVQIADNIEYCVFFTIRIDLQCIPAALSKADAISKGKGSQNSKGEEGTLLK